MDEQKFGKDVSLWIDTTPETDFSAYSGRGKEVDVAIAGGGIAGLLSAWLAQEAGLKVAIVEKSKIVENTTGNTTAKLTSQHYLIYDFLIKKYGQAAGQIYALANQEAIDDIEELSKKLDIDCDFSRRDAYVYTNQPKRVKEIEDEVAAAKKVGLPASFETQIELPLPAKAAIKFANQAQFHPRKFLLPIAQELAKRGALIYEETEATGIKAGSPNILQTKKGDIKAKFIVEATKYPFWQPDFFKDAMWIKLSYVLGVKLADDSYPQGMYITTDDPTRTVRSHPYKDGDILIFGGESHKMTKDYDKNEHYQKLYDDVQRNYKVKDVLYHWIAGDNMPYDRLPYIGPYPDHPNIYAITGFGAWGLAFGMVAARIVNDSILSKDNPWAETFSLKRLTKQRG